MQIIKIYHAVGIALLGFNVWQQLIAGDSTGIITLAFWLAYFLVFCGVLRQNIQCLRLSLLPLVYALTIVLTFTFYNFWSFITGHPLYRDSPATILIVDIFAGVTAVPSLFVLGAYWRHRSKIFVPRQKEFRALTTYMSELSEQGYFVRWMRGLECDLWQAVVEGPFRYGYLMLEEQHIEKLKHLSNRCGGWVILDKQNDEHYVPMKKWSELYAKKVAI